MNASRTVAVLACPWLRPNEMRISCRLSSPRPHQLTLPLIGDEEGCAARRSGPPQPVGCMRGLGRAVLRALITPGQKPVIDSRHSPGRLHGARVPSVGRCATESPPLMAYRASVVPTNLPSWSRRTMRART